MARRRWRGRLAGRLLLVLLIPPLLVTGASLAWRVVQPPVTTLQVIRSLEGQDFRRRVVALDEIAPALARAVIAAEDNLFCRHRGVDWDAFAAEWRRWRAGERPRGASTITMQLTRNLFLWPHRDPVRKGLELGLAPIVDAVLSKRRQLEIYLNQVEFGPGVYGAAAASRHWFDKSADRLSAAEAAALVALLPAPLVFTPDRRREAQRRIARRVDQLGPLLDCAP